MIRVGTQVREAEIDPNWQMYPGETGEIIRRADEEMGFSPGQGGFGRFWMVRIGGEEMVFLDTDLAVTQ